MDSATRADMRAMERLIRRYTRVKDWTMVYALFHDLGKLLEQKENKS